MNILIPIDFSDTSLNALEFAVSIGEKHNASIHLLYVFTEVEFNRRLSSEDVKTFDEYKEEQGLKLEPIAEELRGNSSLQRVEWNVMPGNFLEAVNASIDQHHVDLVVMGTKGAGNIIEKIVGTNTIKLIEFTDVPILTVPEGAKYEGLSKVVYASDYTEEDKITVQSLHEIIKPFESLLTILHLSKSDSLISKAVYEDYVEEISKFLKDQNVEFSRKTYRSNIAIGIDEFMLEKKSNLLVLLRERRNLIDRIFHKSVSKQLTYMLDFPLLVFKC